MKAKARGIIARPGVIRDEVVTPEMLKRYVQYQDSIPLVVGPHPTGGYAYPDSYVGKVIPKWNEEEQRIDGDFWFFDEGWHLIPEEVKELLRQKKKISLSVGYETKTDENTTQKWRKWDHIALGVRNPLVKDVGVNLEESYPDGFRIEETEIMSEEKPDEEPEPAVSMTKAELQEVIDSAVAQAVNKVTEKVTEAEPETVEEEKAPVAEVEARPEPEPEMVLPASAPKKDRSEMEGIEVTEDGWWKFT